jgi:hypothetical protein
MAGNDEHVQFNTGGVDEFLDNYTVARVNLRGLQESAQTQIRAQRTIIEGAEAEINSLTAPLEVKHQELRNLVLDGQKLGKAALEADELPESRRIMAAFMSTASSPEKAIQGATNLALLEVSLSKGEDIPVILGEFRSHQVIAGFIDDYHTDLGGSYNHISLELGNSIALYKAINKDGINRPNVEIGTLEPSLTLAEFWGEIYSGDNMQFSEEPINERGFDSSTQTGFRGLVVGAEGVSNFFTKYTESFTRTAHKTPLDHNPVYILWTSLESVGIEVEVPEELKEAWVELASSAITEAVQLALSGKNRDNSQIPFMIEAYGGLVGKERIEALIIEALNKSDIIKAPRVTKVEGATLATEPQI